MQGTAMEGPIPSAIRFLTKLNQLWAWNFLTSLKVMILMQMFNEIVVLIDSRCLSGNLMNRRISDLKGSSGSTFPQLQSMTSMQRLWVITHILSLYFFLIYILLELVLLIVSAFWGTAKCLERSHGILVTAWKTLLTCKFLAITPTDNNHSPQISFYALCFRACICLTTDYRMLNGPSDISYEISSYAFCFLHDFLTFMRVWFILTFES